MVHRHAEIQRPKIRHDVTLSHRRLIALAVMLSVLAVIAAVAKIVHDRRAVCRLRVATGRQGTEYYAFGEALKTVIEGHQHEVGSQPRLAIELVTDTGGSRDNMDLLQRGQVDLALAQNDTPAAASVRSIALLFGEVLHLYVRGDIGVDEIADLKDKRIATLDQRSGTYCFLEHLLAHYRVAGERSEQLVSLPPDEAHRAFRDGKVDAVFHTIALGPTAKQYIGPSLEHGARLLPIDQAAALKSLHPFLEPAVIPKGFYRGHPPLPERDVPTAAVRAVLLSGSRIPRSVVYRITRILYEHRNEIVTKNPLASQITPPEKPDEGLFPLHDGAQAYYSREKPGFLRMYADPLALGVSMTALCISGLWHLRLQLEKRQKDRADRYNMEILGLVRRVRAAQSVGDLQAVRQKLFDIFGRVLEDLDRDRISTESFQLFAFPWGVAIGAIRHRELTLRHRSEVEAVPAEDSDDGQDTEGT